MHTPRFSLILAGTVAGLSLMTSTVLAQSNSSQPARGYTTSASPSAMAKPSASAESSAAASATPAASGSAPLGAVPVAPPALPPIPFTPMGFTQGAALNVDTGTSQGVTQMSVMRYGGL
jgi:hypothetical protein